MMRLTAYASGSLALASAVILKAVHERTNFFSACIYLSQSNACVIILVNLLVLCVGSAVFGLQRLLYGPLRPIEAEQLYDKAWFAITETCLAMTIFREEIGVWFIILFISLLVGKVWAWIGEGRVEIMDQQPPANPRLFHARITISLLSSLIFDLFLLSHSVDTVRRQAKPNMMVMFAFEFAVLTTGSAATAIRYLISLREAAIVNKRLKERLAALRESRRRELQEASDGAVISEETLNAEIDESHVELPEWEEKSRWILYLELVTDLVRLVLYLVFFVVLCVFYGMPLHIIRDVALALRSFHKRLTDFVKYRRATRDMNERYPDATAEEIGRSDVCIICRELMRPWSEEAGNTDQGTRPKKLPCGHTLHFSCLRRWLQWQQNCPTCRQPVLGDTETPTRPVAGRRRQNQLAGNERPDPPRQQIQERGPDGPEQLNRAARQGNDPNLQAGRADNGWRRFQLGPITLDIGREQDMRQQGIVQQHDNQQRDILDRTQPSGSGYLSPLMADGPLESQLDLLEQQILTHIQNLRLSLAQLEGVRVSYDRFRRSQDSNLANFAGIRVYRNERNEGPIQPGSVNVPPGLVLPEGWTLVPMHSLPQDQVATSASRSQHATQQSDYENNHDGDTRPQTSQASVHPTSSSSPEFRHIDERERNGSQQASHETLNNTERTDSNGS